MPDKIVQNPDDAGVREKYIEQPDGTHALQVAIAGSASSSQATGIDRSMVANTSPQTLMPARAGRLRLMIKNDSVVDVWINYGGTAAAAAGGGNYRIRADGGYMDLVGYSGAVSIIAASGTAAVSALEI